MYRIYKLVNPAYRYNFTNLTNFWRNAGHSKWQNIRHIKAEKDGERAATFSRLRRLMQVAIQEGKSADPSLNLHLAQAIQQAKKANMPNASISSAIQNEKARIQNAGAEMAALEISGPGGSAFIICVVTSNLISLKSKMNPILRKSKFSAGTVAHLFECKSIIHTDFPVNSTLEDAVNIAIELEIDDVLQLNEDDDCFLEFTGASQLLNKFRTQLESRKYSVRLAEVTYTPLTQVSMTDEALVLVNWWYKKLETLPEIVNIFDNISWPEDY